MANPVLHQLTEIPQLLHQTTGQLFRCCLPYSLTLDPAKTMLSALKETAGDRALLIIAIPPDDEIARLSGGEIRNILQFYEDAGIRAIHTPWIEQYSPENHALLDDLVANVLLHLRNGGMVAVHCHSGFGRGGVVLAALLAAQLDSSEDPIKRLQAVDPQFLVQEKPRLWAATHIDKAKRPRL